MLRPLHLLVLVAFSLVLVAASPVKRQAGGTQPLISGSSSVEAHSFETPKTPPANTQLLLEGPGIGSTWPPRKWDLWPNKYGTIKMTGLNLCMEAGQVPRVGDRLKVNPCNGQPWQIFYYHHGFIELVDWGLCVGVTGGYILELQECDHAQPQNGQQRFWAS